jgi:hypothetical protein
MSATALLAVLVAIAQRLELESSAPAPAAEPAEEGEP